jgi:ClpP class serine protease
MNESDIAFLLLASIAVLIVVFAIVRWITTRKEEKENIAASERWDQAQLQSHDQAEASYRAAKTALQGRPGGPMVVDLINDISDDWDSGGAPFRIEYGSATRILDQIKAARESQPIDIVIHTLGGYSLAAELIAAALKARPRTAPTRAYIPYVAMSGGTMVALAADTIYMGKNAALGPIDSLYAGFSGTSYAKLLQTKPADKIDDRTFLLAFEVEKYERDANRKACEIIDDAHKPNGATDCRVVHALMSASRPHSQRIPYSEAKALEMNVEEGCPDEVYALVDARLQMIRTYGQRAQQVGRR